MGVICQKPRTQKQYIVRKLSTNGLFGPLLTCLIAWRSCVVSSICVPSLGFLTTGRDGSAVTHFGRKVANKLNPFTMNLSQSLWIWIVAVACLTNVNPIPVWGVTNGVSYCVIVLNILHWSQDQIYESTLIEFWFSYSGKLVFIYQYYSIHISIPLKWLPYSLDQHAQYILIEQQYLHLLLSLFWIGIMISCKLS